MIADGTLGLLARRLSLRRHLRIRSLRGLSTAEIFSRYYRERLWDSVESVSGKGSSLAATVDLRSELSGVLHDFHVSTLLDVPCGDFNWMSQIDLTDISYLGGDIVPDLISDLSASFGETQRRFVVIDLATTQLPSADALLVRDCLIHLDFASIDQVLRNIANASIRWVLVSNYPDLTRNLDTAIGPAMPVSLVLSPFGLPRPHLEIPDSSRGPYSKTLAAWRIDAFRSYVAASQ